MFLGLSSDLSDAVLLQPFYRVMMMQVSYDIAKFALNLISKGGVSRTYSFKLRLDQRALNVYNVKQPHWLRNLRFQREVVGT